MEETNGSIENEAAKVDAEAAEGQHASMEHTAPKWTDESVDALVKQRIDKQRAKHDAELAEVREKYGEMEKELNELRRSKAVADVAAEFGVPASLIHGSTEDEMRSSAEALASWKSTLPIHPVMHGNGGDSKPTLTKESILAIEDRRERMDAIAQNKHLF